MLYWDQKKVFNRKEQTFSHYDKIFGRKLSEEELVHGLGLFFQFHESKPQIHAIRETIRKFEEIKQWFLKQTTYHFYASSLIVIYDAYLEELLNAGTSTHDETVSNDLTNNNNNKSVAIGSLMRVIMADFAHVFPANNSLDHNYIYGLERLIQHLNLLLTTDYKFKDVRVGK